MGDDRISRNVPRGGRSANPRHSGRQAGEAWAGDAPIGARFKYAEMDTIWVKITSHENGLIVKWNGNVEGHQIVYSFVDKNEGIDLDTEIELI